MGAREIVSTSFDITIVDGRSSQTKIIKANMHLTDLYLEVPVLATAKKTVQLIITTERGNTIFAINELYASSAKTYPIRLSESLMGAITLEVTTDAIVTGDKTFTIELRGYGWVVSDSAEQDGYYYAKLGSTNLYGLEHPSFRITEELNKIPSFEFEIANCEDNRTAIAAGITDVFRIYRRIYSVDTLMFTGIINGDAIEYLSLERIRITGYASYIDLNWRFHQHLNSADAENVNKVFDCFGSRWIKSLTWTGSDWSGRTAHDWKYSSETQEGALACSIEQSLSSLDGQIEGELDFVHGVIQANGSITGVSGGYQYGVILSYLGLGYLHFGSTTLGTRCYTDMEKVYTYVKSQWETPGIGGDYSILLRGFVNAQKAFTSYGNTTKANEVKTIIEAYVTLFQTNQNANGSWDASDSTYAVQRQEKRDIAILMAYDVTEISSYLVDVNDNIDWIFTNRWIGATGAVTWTAANTTTYYECHQLWLMIAARLLYDHSSGTYNHLVNGEKAWKFLTDNNYANIDMYVHNYINHTAFFAYRESKANGTYQTVDPWKGSYEVGASLWGMALNYAWLSNYQSSHSEQAYNYLTMQIVQIKKAYGDKGFTENVSYFDKTTEANNDTINDVPITYSNVNDALYIGQGETFFGMQVKYSTKGVQAANTTVVWEYSKGSSVWATLDVLDETRAFTKDPGTYYVTIPHKPSDWAKDTVNSIKKFWIRARLSEGSYTTQPKLDRIKMTNTDVYRVYYFDTAADTIMDEVLDGTGYSMDITDACPSDTISIVAEYETKLRIVAGIANALTWDDSGDKKGYQWWIDTSKKVHLKQKRGATLGDITGELTILNNIEDYFNLSNRLHFFGNYDGLNQLRAVVENTDSQDTHEIRELAVPEERYNNYIPLKEAAQKAMTHTKAPLQKIAATVTTKYWLDNSFEVGDTVTLHATSWDVASQAFQIVRADIGARVTNLDMGISQEHLDALKAGLQRQLDISGIRMHGSTTLLQFGPETMNYQRVDGSTVYPAHLKFEIPSDARYIHKVLVSWKLGPYRAEVTGGTESEGHDHTGAAGAGGDFTPEVEDGGDHTPTEIGTGSHDHTLDLVLVKTSRAGYLVSQKYVYSEPDHTHPKGVTSLPDDVGNAIVFLNPGTACDSGSCVASWDNASFAEDTHQHLNTGLNTGAAGLHDHNLYTATTVKENYIYAIGIGSNTASTDPDHTHTINHVAAHPHTGVYHGTHSDHVIQTAAASNVDLELGIIEVPGGTVMQLTVNGEDVTTVNGNGTDIVITGYCHTGSNTVELYPIVGSNTKGGATLEGRGILFIEAAKF